MRTFVLCAGTLVASSVLAAQTIAPLFVGVIEDVEPGNLSPAMSGVHVRVAFQKQGAEWLPVYRAYDSFTGVELTEHRFPTSANWTIVFDAKAIGSLSSESRRSADSSGDVNTQTITSALSNLPKVASGAADFVYSGHKARTRPLVLVSAPNSRDPEAWKSTTLTSGEKALAIKEFRKRIPLLEQCDKPEQGPARKVPYSDSEIRFVKVYRAKTGEVLFGQMLDDKRSGCGFFNDEEFFDYWFVMTKAGKLRLLGSQMMPMDAADLDNDGKSEWLFQTSRGEDEDGYELFYNDFDSKSSFSWTYH